MRMQSNMRISRRRFIPLVGGVLTAAGFPRQTWGAHGFPVGIQLYMVNADLTMTPPALSRRSRRSATPR
jgi:hypothetical protein